MEALPLGLLPLAVLQSSQLITPRCGVLQFEGVFYFICDYFRLFVFVV